MCSAPPPRVPAVGPSTLRTSAQGHLSANVSASPLTGSPEARPIRSCWKNARRPSRKRSWSSPRCALKQRHAWVAKALGLALRDLADGYFGIGGRSATGLGSVTVSELSVGEELARFLGEASFERPAVITQADLDLEPAKRKETTDA